jgi:hypothetical protein
MTLDVLSLIREYRRAAACHNALTERWNERRLREQRPPSWRELDQYDAESQRITDAGMAAYGRLRAIGLSDRDLNFPLAPSPQ